MASSRDKRGNSVSERLNRAILVAIQDRSAFAVILINLDLIMFINKEKKLVIVTVNLKFLTKI